MKGKLFAFLLIVGVCPLGAVTEIPASDIGTVYVIKGVLGRPIGTIVTVQCTGIPRSKNAMKV